MIIEAYGCSSFLKTYLSPLDRAEDVWILVSQDMTVESSKLHGTRSSRAK